jgi:catechol 2,3-dioxygenase-like lactoylglutathione lyase family enzyme
MTMPNRATPNLPSRDLAATSAFYSALGFLETFRDANWLILEFDGMQIEFFPYPKLDPRSNVTSCCLRVSDAANLRDTFSGVGLPTAATAIPRLTEIEDQPWGMREFALVDPDGNLLRCLSPLSSRDA